MGLRRPVAGIAATGSYVPGRVLTNHDLAARIDTTDTWIVERTGIRERRIADEHEQASDMATRAAERALAAAGYSPRDLRLIIVGTISADQRLPSCAVHVQRKLGASCAAFDVAAACAGFLYGLDLACRWIATSEGPVLVVGVELLSRLLDWSDRETCVLFGDGAGAVVVDRSPGEGRGVLETVLGADGSAAHLLHIPPGEGVVRMRGREVFHRAVTELSEACGTVLERAGLGPEQVDHVVMHQANRRILEALSRRIGVPWERFHLTIDRWGNTSSASIPLGLDDAVRSGVIEPGQVVLMAALGAGVAWGASVLRW
jgi:3-oxoacyl-[acyl-carrier-protein] synthase-3